MILLLKFLARKWRQFSANRRQGAVARCSYSSAIYCAYGGSGEPLRMPTHPPQARRRALRLQRASRRRGTSPARGGDPPPRGGRWPCSPTRPATSCYRRA